jgi:uncharacterized membrane protein (DUF485 family)
MSADGESGSTIIVYIILCVTLISVFIVAFYFLYVTRVEGDIVREQTELATTELCDELLKLHPAIGSQLAQVLQAPSADAAADARAMARNQLIRRKTLIITAIFLGLGLSLLALMTLYSRRWLQTNVLTDVVLLTGVTGIVEFIFLKFITQQYTVLDGHQLKLDMLHALQQSLPTS